MVGKTRISKLRLGGIAMAGLGAIASAPYVVTTMTANGIAVPGAASAEKLMAMLDGRSPGSRTHGALTTKIKAPKQVARAKPRERALGKVVQPKPVLPQEFAQAITPVIPAAVVPMIAPPTLAEVLTPAGTPTPGGGVLLPPIFGGGGGSPGTPGTPGTPGSPTTPTVPETPPATPAVPEPGTWIMMLLGFGVIGWSARRRTRSAPALGQQA